MWGWWKSLAGVCLTARELTPRALRKQLHRPSLHVCFSGHHHSPWMHDTQLPAQQLTRSPKAGHCTPRHAGTGAGGTAESRDAAVELLPPTSSYAIHRRASTTGNRRPDLGGEAKNCSRRRVDAETGEPRALHLPRSCGTTAREPLFDLWFLMLTENSKLIFTPDLQILKRRKIRKKKREKKGRPSAQGPCSRGKGCPW